MKENIWLLHCDTRKMIADYFTKPLQGSLFKKMRGILMRIDSIDIEERVEENRILTETMPKQQMTVNGKMRRMTQQIIEYLP